MTRPNLVDPIELASWIEAHDGWHNEDGHLRKSFALDYASGLRALVAADVAVSQIDHHPRVTLEYGSLLVELWTHDRGGITSLDLAIADAFDTAARGVASSDG